MKEKISQRRGKPYSFPALQKPSSDGGAGVTVKSVIALKRLTLRSHLHEVRRGVYRTAREFIARLEEAFGEDMGSLLTQCWKERVKGWSEAKFIEGAGRPEIIKFEIFQDFLGLDEQYRKKLLYHQDDTQYSASLNKVHFLSDLEKKFGDAGLSKNKAALLAATAWTTMLKSIVSKQGELYDPILGLKFPPEARSCDFQNRPNRTASAKMSFEEYLEDQKIGWGEYTSKSALSSFWLQELDQPLYLAILYQANKQADKVRLKPRSPQRSAFIDAFFLRHGVMTTAHLEAPPKGLEWQAKLLTFVRKLENKIITGRRGSLDSR